MLRVRKGNSKEGTLVSVLRVADTFSTITLSSITKHADRYLHSLRTTGHRCFTLHKCDPWCGSQMLKQTAAMVWAMMAEGERYRELAALAK